MEPPIINVPIEKIIVDKSIIDAVKKYKGKIPPVKYDPQYTAPLNRMQNMLELKANNIELPPIVLERFGKTGYYTILQGRHRIAIIF